MNRKFWLIFQFVTRTKFRSLIKLLESKSTTVKNKQSYSRTTTYNKYFLFVIVAFFHSKINAILKNICFENQTYEQDASSYVCTQRIQKKKQPKWQVNLSILQIDLIMFQIIILIILQVDKKKLHINKFYFSCMMVIKKVNADVTSWHVKIYRSFDM